MDNRNDVSQTVSKYLVNLLIYSRLNPNPFSMYGTGPATTMNNKKCRCIGLNSRNADITVQSTMNDCFEIDGLGLALELDFAISVVSVIFLPV